MATLSAERLFVTGQKQPRCQMAKAKRIGGTSKDGAERRPVARKEEDNRLSVRASLRRGQIDILYFYEPSF